MVMIKMYSCFICDLFEYDDGYYSNSLSKVLDHIVEIHSIKEITVALNINKLVGVEVNE